MTGQASTSRVQYVLMELCHADVLRTFDDLDDALEVLGRCKPWEIPGQREHGILKFGEDGKPIGEPITEVGPPHA